MAITFDANRKIFTIHTKQTTYQMQADANGYLLHLYYGARTKGSMNYLLCGSRFFRESICGRNGSYLFPGCIATGISITWNR